MSSPDESVGPILHVVVVGFHHKRGCQVEYSFPPMIEGNAADSHELPDEWKYLPPLALPDGAHNTVKDTIFFHLPSRQTAQATVFGISCYRQIDAHELLSRQADITRNTVQKSVCVLSTIPLFGLIQAKLELITHAYFKERDFSKVSLLEETFINLNASLNDSMLQGTQVFLGLSGRDIVQNFKHKVLILFKLMLLERRVLFFTSPVEPICRTMLTILSLFPGMIERGLCESANYNPDQASILHVTNSNSADSEDFLEVQYSSDGPSQSSHSSLLHPHTSSPSDESSSVDESGSSKMIEDSKKYTVNTGKVCTGDSVQLDDLSASQQCHVRHKDSDSYKSGSASLQRSFSLQDDDAELKTDQHMEELLEAEECFSWVEDKLLLEIDEALLTSDINKNPSTHLADKCNLQKSDHTASKDSIRSSSSASSVGGKSKRKLRRRKDKKKVRPITTTDWLISTTSLLTDEHGFPFSVFTKGNLCHPYLSLQYYDLLSDVNVRGFVIGATNHLFKQKKHLVDVVVEIADSKLDIHDAELRKQLTLSTADLRFADFLVRNVSDDRGDIFLDDTEWEGGDEWLRGQFRLYLLSLLATVNHNDDKLEEDFNSHFISAWKTTHNYKVWQSSTHKTTETLKQLEPGHPFHGQLSMSDMKLKFSHSMQSTEHGKKINAAVQQTGKVVLSTTKVMGGALSTAKTAVTSWFSSLSSHGNNQASSLVPVLGEKSDLAKS